MKSIETTCPMFTIEIKLRLSMMSMACFVLHHHIYSQLTLWCMTNTKEIICSVLIVIPCVHATYLCCVSPLYVLYSNEVNLKMWTILGLQMIKATHADGTFASKTYTVRITFYCSVYVLLMIPHCMFSLCFVFVPEHLLWYRSHVQNETHTTGDFLWCSI